MPGPALNCNAEFLGLLYVMLILQLLHIWVSQFDEAHYSDLAVKEMPVDVRRLQEHSRVMTKLPVAFH